MVEPMLSIRGLNKRFGGLKVTDDVDLDIMPNQIHSIIGPNGAGKTTLVAQIAGELLSDKGVISFRGQDITAFPVEKRASGGLVRSYQITSIFRNLSVYENLAIGVQSRQRSTFRFFDKSAAMHVRDEVYRIAEKVELKDDLYANAAHLSHGQQRQLEVGLALTLQPRLLLLDEPMAGLSSDQMPWFVHFVENLKADNLSILLIEHDMDAVFKLSDAVSVLVAGRRIFTGSPQEARNSPLVRQAYLGEE